MFTTFLDLCTGLMQEAGIAGDLVSVQNQTGEKKRVVGWIQRACSVVEGKYVDWNFLHEFYQFNTVAGVSDYPPPENHNFWDDKTFNDITSANSKIRLDFILYTRQKEDVTTSLSGTIYKFSVLPSQAIRLYDTPDSVRTVSAEYFRAPTELVQNTDTPAIPKQYRDIIVYKALMYYAKFENADELLLQATTDYNDRLLQLEARELPASQAAQARSTGMDIQVTTDDGFYADAGYGR